METVLVERAFGPSSPLDIAGFAEKQAEFAWCFETYRVEFVQTFISNDGQRMTCIYRAPDAESVRNVQETAGLPYERIWTGRPFDGEAVQGILARVRTGEAPDLLGGNGAG